MAFVSHGSNVAQAVAELRALIAKFRRPTPAAPESSYLPRAVRQRVLQVIDEARLVEVHVDETS